MDETRVPEEEIVEEEIVWEIVPMKNCIIVSGSIGGFSIGTDIHKLVAKQIYLCLNEVEDDE